MPFVFSDPIEGAPIRGARVKTMTRLEDGQGEEFGIATIEFGGGTPLRVLAEKSIEVRNGRCRGVQVNPAPGMLGTELVQFEVEIADAFDQVMTAIRNASAGGNPRATRRNEKDAAIVALAAVGLVPAGALT